MSPARRVPGSYTGTHIKLRAIRGPARDYTCRCGAQAQEWAYNNRSTTEKTDAYGRYSLNLDDYDPLCISCHRTQDAAAAITHCPQGHEYAGRNVVMDRGNRKCRICVNARARARTAKKAVLRRAQGSVA